MARREVIIEGPNYQQNGWYATHGALFWDERVPIVNPRADIRDGILGLATDFQRNMDAISCEVPDFMEKDWEFSVMVDQSNRATGRKGNTIILFGRIIALIAVPIPYEEKK